MTPVSGGRCLGCGLKIVKKEKAPPGQEPPADGETPGNRTVARKETAGAARSPRETEFPRPSNAAANLSKPPSGRPRSIDLPPAEKLPAEQIDTPPAAAAKTKGTAAAPAQSGAVAVKSSPSGLHMPKLQIKGLERHDDDARRQGAAAQKVKRIEGLDPMSSSREDGGKIDSDDAFKSLILEPHEHDGHTVKKESPDPPPTKNSDISSFLLSPHETFGEGAADIGAEEWETDEKSSKLTFKPRYQDEFPQQQERPREDRAVAPPGHGKKSVDDMMRQAGFGESNITPGFDSPFDSQGGGAGHQREPGGFTAHPRSEREVPKADDEDILFQARKIKGKRRLFTRFLPLALLCFGLWYGGAEYGIPFLLVQGRWEGRLFDADELSVPVTIHFERKGRQLTGTAHLDIPESAPGIFNLSKTPKIVLDVFATEDANVIGLFDLHKLRVKLYAGDPDNYIQLVGDIRRDKDYQLMVRGDAENPAGSEAQFIIYQTSFH